jgi:hypothetical protein
MNAIPRTAYRFRQFLPSKLSTLLALFPLLHSDLRAVPPVDDCSLLFSPFSPLLLCNSSHISSSDFHPRLPFRLLLPSTPSVKAINAIPPAAYRFRLFSPLPTPSVRATNALHPSVYCFRPSPLSPLLICNSSRVLRRLLPSLTAFSFSRRQRHLSGLSTQFLPLPTDDCS